MSIKLMHPKLQIWNSQESNGICKKITFVKATIYLSALKKSKNNYKKIGNYFQLQLSICPRLKIPGIISRKRNLAWISMNCLSALWNSRNNLKNIDSLVLDSCLTWTVYEVLRSFSQNICSKMKYLHKLFLGQLYFWNCQQTWPGIIMVQPM